MRSQRSKLARKNKGKAVPSKTVDEALQYIEASGLMERDPVKARWLIKRARALAVKIRYYERYPDKALTYHGQINSEAWQARRREIIELNDSVCRLCDKALNVHEDSIIVRRQAFNEEDKRLLSDIPDNEFEVVCRACGNRDKHNRTKCPDKMSDSDKLSDSPTVTF